MPEEACGYREIDHTADWELEVWARDIEGVLEQAALGMYEMAKLEMDESQRLTRRFELDAPDDESLIVRFLSDLLYRLQMEHLAFNRFHLDVTDGRCEAFVVGHPVVSIDKEIKAVTWHDMCVEREDGQVRARVTFDV